MIKALPKLLRAGIVLALPAVMGCGNAAENIGLGTAIETGLLARAPTEEIEQIYYLGVFDSQEQLAPTVYRIRVHGQASAISFMKFGSGWVPAELIDSLSTSASFAEGSNSASVTGSAPDSMDELRNGKRLILFGPEGFREAPRNHRLVIVMGASPDKYFQAMDQALGLVSQTQSNQSDANVSRQLFVALDQVKGEQDRLGDLSKDVASQFQKPAAK